MTTQQISPSPAAPETDEDRERSIQPVDDEAPPRLPFPVIGVGASAGGLEAFMSFFQAMHADPGMAFVLVQHLPPERESLVAGILASKTKMPVLEVRDGMPVEINHVYVIRPGHTLTVHDGALHLGESLARRGHGRPVDDFFRSLASEQRERAVGILMSGMGSNGTAGAQAIKAVGGLCIAQDPDSAQFPSMPRHLIEQGYADFILRPENMPELLLRYAEHPYASGWRESPPRDDDRPYLVEILAILRARTRQDFLKYKKQTVLRRVQRRMGVHQLTRMSDYARLLRQQPAEAPALADDLLIHVTGFFRDKEAWAALREHVLIPLVTEREDGGAIRAWVTACSSGEEAYSLAILLAEEALRLSKHFDVKVFATDMAAASLAHARAGLYPGGIESEIQPELLERYFSFEDGMYRVKKELRELVVFAPQNILQDPPFSRLDLCCCRNLLIYLEPETQQQLLSVFHFGLRENGALFLGTSETASSAEAMFEPIDKRWRIFRRVGPPRRRTVDFTLSPSVAGEHAVLPPSRIPPRATLGQLTERALLDRYAPAAVVIDRDNRIVFFHGDTDRFLSQPTGEPTRELLVIARDGVRAAVRAALQKATLSNGEVVTVRDGLVETDQGRRRVAVSVSPLDAEGASSGSLVAFELLPEPALVTSDGRPSDPIDDARVRDELRLAREELQAMVAQLQSSNEELKAANEESSSINEELQSTNEELETSKEEMQSLNEELTTVNAQLHAKVEEHEATTNDLSSLLSSTELAVVFLDTQFRIRRYTPSAKDLFDLIPSDVGRPLGDLARKFDDPQLMGDASSVLERLTKSEREITSTSGRWYLRRALPYRTTDDRISGVVITFVDITNRKQMEHSLAETARLLDLTTDAMSLRREDDTILYWNAAATSLYGWSREEALGKKYTQMVGAQRERPIGEVLATLAERGSSTITSTHTTRDGRKLAVLSRLVLDRSLEREGTVILTTTTDMTEHNRKEEALLDRDQQLRLLVEGARDFAMLTLDETGRVTTWNVGAERLLGYAEAEALGQRVHSIFTQEDRLAGVADEEMGTAASAGRADGDRWYQRKDGTRFWGSGVTTAIRGAKGDLRGFVKVLRNETARKTAEDTLLEAARRAEAANHMKDEFLGTLSHELRTPLSAIVMWARLLKSGGLTPEKTSRGVEAIARSAEAQSQLIDDLLDTSRITSGKLRLEMRVMDPAPLLSSAVTAMHPTAHAKGVELETALAPDVGHVLADPDRLQQVLWNLLSNAVKFTPHGGRVVVSLRQREGRVELLVEDSGQGIDAAFLPHMFDAFRQADSATTRSHGGLGLGLAICRQLVQLHAGTIEARSDGQGKGATFVVSLPLSTRARRTSVANDTLPESSTPPTALRDVNVLVVEDAEDTREALVAVLESTGARVVAVESSAAGLDAFRARRPDVIVSDIGLPEEDGYAFIRRIRGEETKTGAPRVPAVALTSFARPQDRADAIDAGFDHHLRKPAEPAEILEVLGSLIRALPRA